MAILLAICALAAQDGDVERIMLRFRQRSAQVRTETQFKQLLAETRGELETFLREKPKDKEAPRAAWHVAESYLTERNFDKGLEQIDAFLKAYPDSEFAPQARLARADVYLLEREDDGSARAAFEDFVRAHPKDERALLARLGQAVTLQNERKYDEAAAILVAARRDYKDRRESWGAAMQLAVLYHVQERNVEARAALEDIIRNCPDHESVEVARRHLSEYLKVGREAPAFSERDLKLAEVSLEKLRGKVVALYFFDSNQTTAVPEAAFLKKVREAFGAQDLQLVGASVNLEKKDLSLFLAQMKVDWPVLFDGKGYDGRLARLYEVRQLPALTVVDRKGKVRFFNVAGRDLRNCITKLLEEK